jgi:hypothetical protein
LAASIRVNVLHAVSPSQLEFFKGIDIERGAASIVFTCTPDGRPKGEVYVEFPNEDAQKEALKRHKNEMGERYIELFLSTKANMIQVRAGLLCALPASHYSGNGHLNAVERTTTMAALTGACSDTTGMKKRASPAVHIL